MMLVVDEQLGRKRSRLALVALVDFSLRLMHNWKHELPDFETAAIVMSVVAIRAEKLTRTEMSPESEDLANSLPPQLLRRCNVSSIASATGLNRETARRKVKWLIGKGVLMREDDGGLGLAAGILQLPVTLEITEQQLMVFARCANQLLRSGILRQQDDPAPAG